MLIKITFSRLQVQTPVCLQPLTEAERVCGFKSENLCSLLQRRVKSLDVSRRMFFTFGIKLNE